MGRVVTEERELCVKWDGQMAGERESLEVSIGKKMQKIFTKRILVVRHLSMKV
jgi:hypothetical protein